MAEKLDHGKIESPRALSRRDLFRLGLVAGSASLAAACGWDGGPHLEPKLRGFSRVNDWVGEKLLLSDGRLAPQYAKSARTLKRCDDDSRRAIVDAGRVSSCHSAALFFKCGLEFPKSFK